MIDTNVLLRNFLTSSFASPNSRVFALWFVQRHLQLIVSGQTIEEHLRLFEEVLGMKAHKLSEWRDVFEEDKRCTMVNLGRRYTESRDPDDNIFLATAHAGKVEYLITNDRDLLDLPEDFQRTLPFAVVTPAEFLKLFEGE